MEAVAPTAALSATSPTLSCLRKPPPATRAFAVEALGEGRKCRGLGQCNDRFEGSHFSRRCSTTHRGSCHNGAQAVIPSAYRETNLSAGDEPELPKLPGALLEHLVKRSASDV